MEYYEYLFVISNRVFNLSFRFKKGTWLWSSRKQWLDSKLVSWFCSEAYPSANVASNQEGSYRVLRCSERSSRRAEKNIKRCLMFFFKKIITEKFGGSPLEGHSHYTNWKQLKTWHTQTGVHAVARILSEAPSKGEATQFLLLVTARVPSSYLYCSSQSIATTKYRKSWKKA